MNQPKTEKHQETQADIYTEQALLHLIDAVPTAIAVIDNQMKVSLANASACSMFSRTHDQLIGKTGGEAFGCTNRNDVPEGCGFGPDCIKCKLRQTVDNTLKLKQSYKMVETSMAFRSRERMYLRISTLPLNLTDYEGALLSIEDISRAREYEMAKMEKERLSAAVQTAGAICHEMNQPLMAIQGFSELLAYDLPPDSDHKENLAEIKKQAQRLGTITSKLMRLTRYKTKRYLNGDILDIDAGSCPDRMRPAKQKESGSL